MSTISNIRDIVASRSGLTLDTTMFEYGKTISAFSQLYDCQPGDIPSLLTQNPAAFDDFVSFLTVGETYFLRHSEQLVVLRTYIQEKLRTMSPEETLTIWSAGCSSGEEPYTLRISLREYFGSREDQRIHIYASDINKKAIISAQQGVYNSWSFRRTPAWFLAKYFDASDKNRVSLNEDIKKSVTFFHRSISDHMNCYPLNSLNAIFFRNVAIYLDKASIKSIYERFSMLLQNTGLLFIAPADPSPPPGLFVPFNPEYSSIYVKTESRKACFSVPLVSRKGPIPGSKPLPIKPIDRSASTSLEKISDHSLTIERLGNSGNIDQALCMANAVITSSPVSSIGYMLRGQLHFSKLDIDSAVADFRRAVFLNKEDKLARFWYATALKANSSISHALIQCRVIINQLSHLPPNTLIEDGETTVAELLKAALFLKESCE